MKIKAPQTISNVNSLEDLIKFSDQIFNQIVAVINGKIDLNDNLDVSFTTFTFNSANTNYQVNHTLGRIPIGYIPVTKSVSTDIYNGVGTNTTTSLFLKSTVANATVMVMVF